MKRSDGLTQPPFGPWRFDRAATSSALQSCDLAGPIDDGGLADQGHRLGERLVVVIKPDLTEPRVLIEAIMLDDVFIGGLDAWVVLP